MLTGDNEPPEGTEPTTAETIEKTSPAEGEELIKKEIEEDEKAVSYNDAINK